MTARVGGVLLAHGAGSDKDHPTLVAIERALAPLPVHRFDFPYRTKGPRRPPDRAPVLLGSVRAEATGFAVRLVVPPERLVLGGRSMGGRMCSMAAADGLPAAGLVLLGYPLHPPGRPDRLRTEHLPQLEVPCLFVSGTRDPFAAPDELRAAAATIPGPVSHHWVEGARHELRGADDEVAAVVRAWLADLPHRPVGDPPG